MTTQPAAAAVTLPPAVACFLRGLETGEWGAMESCLAPDVLYDATVPGWHYQYEGNERVLLEYREEWTGKHTWRIVERHAPIVAEGVAVVDLEARGRCPGDTGHASHEEAVRIANIFHLVGGRIAEHRFYCCGEWDEETLHRIETEAPHVDRAPRDAVQEQERRR
jgi:hypothetical protein